VYTYNVLYINMREVQLDIKSITLRYLNDSPPTLLYDWFGVDEYKVNTCKYHIVATDNSSAYRSKTWLTFDRQLNN